MPKHLSCLKKENPEDLFELEESLGEGSYGEVFKARYKDPSKTEKVAVKIIPVDEEMSDLEKEIDILQKTQDSFIVQYVGAYKQENPERIWIVMELCLAGSVNDLIHLCNTNLAEEEIREVVASVLLGLHYLHSNKMIHRDVKAGNILLTDDGRAKLADFGVSATLDNNQSKRKTVIGTPYWMGPEVISETSYDGKADIWSLGITIIEMAEKDPPYSNIHPMRAIFMIPSRPPPKLQHPSTWSPEMNAFLARCLQKNPDDRPTAEELFEDPFVAEAVERLDTSQPRGRSAILHNLVETHIDMIDQARKEDAQHRTMSTRDSTTSGGMTIGNNTAIYIETSSGNKTKDFGKRQTDTLQPADSGTLITSGKGTSIFTPSATTSKKFEPFMEYFKPKAYSNKDKDTLKIPNNAKEMIELTQRLQNLDKQFQQDVSELRRAYEKRRQALVSAAGQEN